MTRFDDPLHDQRQEERDRQARAHAEQYALDTLALADPEPSKPRQRPRPRPTGPHWGDDIEDPLNGAGIPTEGEYMAAVNEHSRRRFPW